MKKIMLIAGILIVLLAANAIAVEYVHICLLDGESIPITKGYSSNSGRGMLICGDGKCTAHLRSGSGWVDICVQNLGAIYSPPGLLSNCEGGCTFLNTINPEPLELEVGLPFSNEGVYTKQSFYLNISTNKIANIDLIDSIAGSQVNLCPNCRYYNRPRTFKAGFNDITIRAVKGNEIVEKTITFIIDNKKPIISKTLPLSGKFAKSDFSIVYTEDFVKEVLFVYGNNNTGFRQKNLTNCASGKLQTCVASVDLNDYNGKDISYVFNITDIAGNKGSSRLTKVKVDLTPPVVNNDNIFNRTGSSVIFKLNITESNMDRVYYTDNGENEKILCSSLSRGMCNKKLSFRIGNHSIQLFVRDKAGNQVTLGPYAFTI
jgi:hypothetical protein